MKAEYSAFQIEKILAEEILDNKPHYLIKWKGYSTIESTWQPIENLLHVLDIVHAWKIKNSPHTKKKQRIMQNMQVKNQKTKKIGGKKQHVIRQKQINIKLDNKKTKKFSLISSDEQEERISIDSCNSKQKQIQTGQFSFGQQQYIPQKRTKSKNRNINNQFSSSKNNSKHEQRSLKDIVADKKKQLNGFRVIGQITKQGIKSVVLCFDWQGEKVCEVQLRDGRKVNIKRDDVKKICPDKLLEYYEKLQKVSRL